MGQALNPKSSVASRSGLLVLAALPALISLAAVPVSLEARSGLLVAFCLLGTSFALLGLAAAATQRRFGWILTASVPFATFFVWHLRETLSFPTDKRLFLTLVVAIAGLTVPLIRAVFTSVGPRRVLAATLGIALISAGTSATAFITSPRVRSLLALHVRSLGTPLHYSFGRTISVEAERAMWPGTTLREPLAIPADTPPLTRSTPDLYFVLVDTLRADAIPPWGDSTEDLATFRGLADRSVRFANVHANSSWTRPSVASFLTGLYPEQHGARDREDALSPSVPTLAELFRARGYDTIAFVANYGAAGKASGLSRGFDEFFEIDGLPYARAERVRTLVEDWIVRVPTARPRFVYIHFLDPHAPYLSGSAVRTLDPSAHVPAYREEVRYLDRELGRLLTSLERNSSRPLTIFLTSDHGQEFGEHSEGGHGHTLYRELLHVPTLLLDERLRPRQIAEPLEAVDFAALLSLIPDSDFTIEPWLQQAARGGRYASLSLTTDASIFRPYRKRAVARRIDLDSSSLIWSAYTQAFERYDLDSDPGERRNLFGTSMETDHRLQQSLRDAVPTWTEAQPIRSSNEMLLQLRALGYN